MMVPSNIEAVAQDWCSDEHWRLHGPHDSALSDVNHIRSVTALEVDDQNNMPVLKSRQHIQRLLLRIDYLPDADTDTDFRGRCLSDCLKLLAGWQVKAAIAQSADQADFFDRILSGEQGVGQAMRRASADLARGLPNALPQEAEKLHGSLERSLGSIAERARLGHDWGKEDSPMRQACLVGQVACCRMFIATVNYLAQEHGGDVSQVPLRPPAADADEVGVTYPFVT